MNVVTCYEAAKIARVSKQIMSTRKKVNALDKSKYKYFAYDRKDGDFGVDLDHNDWKKYMTKRRSTPKFKNDITNNTNSHAIVNENDNLVDKTKLVNAVVKALTKKLGLAGNQMKAVLQEIEREYEGMV